jgi:hypothetical protein
VVSSFHDHFGPWKEVVPSKLPASLHMFDGESGKYERASVLPPHVIRRIRRRADRMRLSAESIRLALAAVPLLALLSQSDPPADVSGWALTIAAGCVTQEDELRRQLPSGAHAARHRSWPRAVSGGLGSARVRPSARHSVLGPDSTDRPATP